MGLRRNRTAIGIVAIVIASTICFVIQPIYNKSLEDHVKVVQISKNIKKGEKVKSNNVKITECMKRNIPKSHIDKVEDVVGKYAVVDMKEKDIVSKEKISKNPLSEDEYLYNLNGDQQAISFTIKNFASGLSGKLETGDIISIIATSEDNNGNEKTYTPKELTYVKVLATTNSDGQDKKEGEKTVDEKENLPVTITVLANKQQAELIAKLESKSQIHVSLAFRGTEIDGADYLNKQNSMF